MPARLLSRLRHTTCNSLFAILLGMTTLVPASQTNAAPTPPASSPPAAPARPAVSPAPSPNGSPAASPQGASPTPSAPPAPSESPAPGTTPPREPGAIVPYALADIASQAEAAESKRRKIEVDLASWEEGNTIESELRDLAVDIAIHLDESEKAIISSPSFESLPELEKYWKGVTESLGEWKKQLTGRIQTLQGVQGSIKQTLQTWESTRDLAQTEGAPPDVMQRITAVQQEYAITLKNVEAESGTLLKLQARVAELETKVGDVLAAIRQEMVKGLFARDKEPIWNREARADASLRPLNELLAAQWSNLKAYAAKNSDLFMAHGLAFFLIFFLLLHWRKVAASSSQFASLQKLFKSPLAAALLLTLTLAEFVAPPPPRLFWILWTGAALTISIYLLLPLIRQCYLPLLTAVLALFLFDEARDFTSSSPLIWRLLLLVETVTGLLFTLWALRRSAFNQEKEEQESLRWKVTHLALRAALILFGVATVANIFGYARPAAFLVNALSEFANHTIIVYAFVRLLDGYLLVILSNEPLRRISAIAHHRDLVWKRLCLAMRWLALAAVLLVTLQMLGLRSIVLESVQSVLTTTLPFTTWSIQDVLHFGLTIWAAFLLSRFIRFLLDEEVYPRLQLTRGLPYAISTVLHYTILLGGFLAAVGNLSRFTVLAGAFGVGLGFGLQNIVNNFVSGLILLFERPVKVGDVVQIDADTGVVQRIGIRASVIRTPSGSELILPNSKLISDKVTNWTFSSRQRGFEIPLSIPRSADPAAIIRLLEETAKENPRVSNFPAPQALLIKLTAATLDFELRAWTNQYEDWTEIRSELSLAIHKAFTEANILPLP